MEMKLKELTDTFFFPRMGLMNWTAVRFQNAEVAGHYGNLVRHVYILAR